MMRNIMSFVGLTSHAVKSEIGSGLLKNTAFNRVGCQSCGVPPAMDFHSTQPRTRDDRFRKSMKESLSKDLLDVPEFSLSIKRNEDQFPTFDLPQRLFQDVPFKDIPIVLVTCSRNNTKFALSDKGKLILNRACGNDGFKNTRKGTNLSAQTTGCSFGMRAIKQGYKNCRVILRGFGPGRLSSLKGMILSGMNVISISDNSVDYTGRRPRKQRRL